VVLHRGTGCVLLDRLNALLGISLRLIPLAGSSAIASGDTVTDTGGTTTNLGNDDVAFAVGQETMAGSGVLFTETASSNDIAMVFDPFGAAGSEALAGIGNFDLAEAFGDMLHVVATSGNFMADILPML
jgi:hypothetical protein